MNVLFGYFKVNAAALEYHKKQPPPPKPAWAFWWGWGLQVLKGLKLR
jgi:hypothetical protein